MAFKFDKLWDILGERNISKEQLRVAIRASQTTIVKMGQNGNVSLEVIDKICNFLQCSSDDIMEHVLDEDPTIKERSRITKGSIFLHNISREATTKNDFSEARPVIVLQSSDMCKGAHSIYVAPILTNTQAVFPHGVLIHPSIKNGLRDYYTQNCIFIGLTQIKQLPATLLIKKIGDLSQDDISKLDDAMRMLFDLP